jgi:hypothetical protein
MTLAMFGTWLAYCLLAGAGLGGFLVLLRWMP